MFKFSTTSKERLSTIDIRLADLMKDALAVSPVDFGVPSSGGIRTVEEQFELFRVGKSNCDGVIKISRHQSGKAVDIFAYINGGASWDREYYYMLAGVILVLAQVKGLSIRWGGSWDGSFDFNKNSFNDLCHFEILD